MDHRRFARTALTALLWTCIAYSAVASEAYRPITATTTNRTITLTGHDLTIDQVVDIARHGAKVAVSGEAMQRAADSFGLMLEAQHEGIPVYRFNRLAGSGREIATMTGDPDSAENTAKLAARHDARSGTIGQGPFAGFGEDIPDEDIGRAMLAVNANIVTYEAASPAYIKGIVDLLNYGVTPAVHWRGAIGESDFVPVAATMTGRGFAYFKGLRMPAAEALAKAGLKPIHLEGNDEALGTTSALTAGFAALLVNDARELIEWHDLIWAMDLDGMNGNVGPLSMPVQATRPFPWANFAALRVLDMLRGSYVFDDEYRILQDAESLRATVWRDGGVWGAWARLRQHPHPDEFHRSQSDLSTRRFTTRFLGTRNAPADEILCEGGEVQSRKAWLYFVEFGLGPLSPGRRCRGVSGGARQSDGGRRPTYASIRRPVLHGHGRIANLEDSPGARGCQRHWRRGRGTDPWDVPSGLVVLLYAQSCFSEAESPQVVTSPSNDTMYNRDHGLYGRRRHTRKDAAPGGARKPTHHEAL